MKLCLRVDWLWSITVVNYSLARNTTALVLWPAVIRFVYKFGSAVASLRGPISSFPEVFITHYHRQKDRQTDITAGFHIASFASTDGRRQKYSGFTMSKSGGFRIWKLGGLGWG